MSPLSTTRQPDMVPINRSQLQPPLKTAKPIFDLNSFRTFVFPDIFVLQQGSLSGI